MPVVTKGKVLVTGANGYIAVWVVKSLLDQGYSVRGTVRREPSIPYLKELFKDYADRLEFVVVPDITKVCPLPLDTPTLLDGDLRTARSTKPLRV